MAFATSDLYIRECDWNGSEIWNTVLPICKQYLKCINSSRAFVCFLPSGSYIRGGNRINQSQKKIIWLIGIYIKILKIPADILSDNNVVS